MHERQTFHARSAHPDVLADAEAELASAQRDLEHSQRLATLGTLSAGIAHEINNILTPVLAYAQLAISNSKDRQLQIKALEKAVQGVETATRITQAMLGFAASPDEPESACVPEVLQSALDCIGRDPAKDRIQVSINMHPDICVCMRPLALQQVLMNLILNACAALKSRGGSLSISASVQSDDTALIRVSDSGPGIPADVAARLFEPFVSARRGALRHPGPAPAKQGGSGLGLAICKRLIDAANGSISATSKPDQGTTFSIVLPSAQVRRAKAI